MHRCDLRVRSATTDRAVGAQTVVTEGVGFYKTISSIEGMAPELAFNFDEFFTCLGDNAKWAWGRVKVAECIPKEGVEEDLEGGTLVGSRLRAVKRKPTSRIIGQGISAIRRS